MTAIDSRHLRIFRDTTAAEPAKPAEARFDDPARLARREPRRLPQRRAYGAHANAQEPASNTLLLTPEEASPEPGTSPALSEREQPAWLARAQQAVAPLVSSVARQQQQGLHVLEVLTREIGAFCSDRAIVASGQWEANLTLDPRLLPNTILTLTLSRFSLLLRFDARDCTARDLLLAQSRVLQRELANTLRAWGEDREIELTVW